VLRRREETNVDGVPVLSSAPGTPFGTYLEGFNKAVFIVFPV
jgi:hypothetical protein